LLLVLLILGVLAAIATVSIVGLLGHGQEESYDVDERTIQLALVTFHADVHVYDVTDDWNEDSGAAVHNYPTASGQASGLYRSETESTINDQFLYRLMEGTGDPADDDDIPPAAIWMGLLVNGPGSGQAGDDIAPGDDNSPLQGESGPYLLEVPKSCSTYNSSTGSGTYTWIVGSYSRVYGVFQWATDEWYVGFNGTYP
jgi:hypothetical protein